MFTVIKYIGHKMDHERAFRVVIPSWGVQSPQMQAETGTKFPVFISLKGQPLWVHIINLYKEVRDKTDFVIILREDAPDIDLNLVSGFDVKVVRLNQSYSIGHSILEGLSGLSQDKHVFVHMADTLIDKIYDFTADNIYVQKRSDLYRWTSITCNKSGMVRIKSDREAFITEKTANVCVGLFSFAQGYQFKTHLQNSFDFQNEDMDPFFRAIETYSETNPIALLNAEGWRDFGHVDSYYEARLNFNNLRHFNELSYDIDSGIVTKKSENTEAYRHQVRWFSQIPDEMSYFLPKIYDSNDGAVPHISMEFLSIPTLNELFISERLEIGAWNNVARKVKKFMNLAQKYEFQSTLAKYMAREMYVNKTQSRLNKYINADKEVASYWVENRGVKLGILDVLEVLEDFCNKFKLLESNQLTPIHGDLCFTNILYDVRSRQIKLIDPRGEFGVPGIYGDPKYDKAKMMHSYSGHYDFIVSDRFKFTIENNQRIHGELPLTNYHQQVKYIMDNILFDSSSYEDKRSVEAIEALLFLSMLPLHADKPNRQKIILFIGLSKFTKLWMEE